MDDWKAKQAAKAAAAKAMQAANPHLVPAGAGRDCAIAAKNIRIELKAAFPGVKFSVRSRSFSMGNAIDIGWTDGPVTVQVDEIVGKYSAGSFDGMTDCYEYSRNPWGDAFGSAKYVHTRRELSDAAIAGAIRTLRAKYPGNMAGVEASVADYRAGKLWSVAVPGLTDGYGAWGLQDLVSQIAYSRTFALAKKAKAAKFEEAAAC